MAVPRIWPMAQEPATRKMASESSLWVVVRMMMARVRAPQAMRAM